MTSNLSVRSNLMLDDEKHKPQHRYLPGDFVKEVYPDLVDTRIYLQELTKVQIIELQQYLVCIRCHRPCAGTCGR
jgi:hypothetical protein